MSVPADLLKINMETVRLLTQTLTMSPSERKSFKIERVLLPERVREVEKKIVVLAKLISYEMEKTDVYKNYAKLEFPHIQIPEDLDKVMKRFRKDLDAVTNKEYEKTIKQVNCA